MPIQSDLCIAQHLIETFAVVSEFQCQRAIAAATIIRKGLRVENARDFRRRRFARCSSRFYQAIESEISFLVNKNGRPNKIPDLPAHKLGLSSFLNSSKNLSGPLFCSHSIDIPGLRTPNNIAIPQFKADSEKTPQVDQKLQKLISSRWSVGYRYPANQVTQAQKSIINVPVFRDLLKKVLHVHPRFFYGIPITEKLYEEVEIDPKKDQLLNPPRYNRVLQDVDFDSVDGVEFTLRIFEIAAKVSEDLIYEPDREEQVSKVLKLAYSCKPVYYELVPQERVHFYGFDRSNPIELLNQPKTDFFRRGIRFEFDRPCVMYSSRCFPFGIDDQDLQDCALNNLTELFEWHRAYQIQNGEELGAVLW